LLIRIDEEEYDEEEEEDEEEEVEEEEAESLSEHDYEKSRVNSVPKEKETDGELLNEETRIDENVPNIIHFRHRPTVQLIEKDKNEALTEAEKAMLASKKRQEEEAAAALQDYEEHRKVEREKVEQELKNLKAKQERRRQEREEEEREFAERQRLEEERHRQEEEERKAKIEADKRRKEEEKKKRQMLVGSFVGVAQTGGRSFVLPRKIGDNATNKFGNIVQAKQEMGMTKEQQEEVKRSHLESIKKTLDFAGLSLNDLKEKIKQLHQRICRLEADKYDLMKRHERQEYDLRELNERQRQVARSKAAKKGLDPDSVNSRYPPKVAVISKFERQIDRRTFSERRAVYDQKNAYPCFPNVPPPPTIYARVIPAIGSEIFKEDDDEAENEEKILEAEE
uniref:Troponin T n=1 Tax=Dracunculus medinensis TaxID=318479 RepID=A0A0N4U1R4_DRAME